jgi:hypothetical protein
MEKNNNKANSYNDNTRGTKMNNEKVRTTQIHERLEIA